ncbi:MAG: IS66 family transposase [Nannocystales bacterium]
MRSSRACSSSPRTPPLSCSTQHVLSAAHVSAIDWSTLKLEPGSYAQMVSPRRSCYGEDLHYMLLRWKGLSAFLDDPHVEIHNNQTERALRGMVQGRKNHYGSRSKRGTEVAAIMYSLVESAKLCGVNPVEYLFKAAVRGKSSP